MKQFLALMILLVGIPTTLIRHAVQCCQLKKPIAQRLISAVVVASAMRMQSVSKEIALPLAHAILVSLAMGLLAMT